MSQPYEIKMPQLSDTMTEGVVVSWEKKIGDKIERGDIVATVETDKAIMDVEVFRDGFLSGPLAAVDSTVAVGQAIAYLVATADQVGQAALEGSGDQPVSQPAETEAAAPDAQGSPAKEPEGVVNVIKMPQLSDTMEEGVIVSWEKQLGDKIERGDIVATVETDKAIMDVEVFRAGYLSGPMAMVDSVVPVGAAMAYLVEQADQVITDTAAAAAKPSMDSSAEKVEKHAPSVQGPASPKLAPDLGARPADRPNNRAATPLARKLAGQLNINLNTVKGTGPQGEITANDVQQMQPAATQGPVAGQAMIPQVDVPGDGRPMNAMEKAVSHTMTGSLTMPTFRVSLNAQPGALIKAAKAKGVSVTVAIAKACAVAIEQHPMINWCYQPVDKLVERSNVDIGMAVSADGGGLVVPVLRGCESKDLEQLNNDWKELVDKARKRRLAPDEYANPTFMVSNMGMMGVRYFDAIPTPGTAAILAISTADDDGMPLTVTADHRVANGAEVAQFLNTLKKAIEQPQDWMGSTGPAIPEGEWDYDVVVIGGGPGGEDCARDLAARGIKVAMVNDAPFPGGECLWRGCIPSKAWRAAADRIRDRADDEHLGIKGTTRAKLDWQQLEKTRTSVLETRGDMALKTDKGVRIKVIQGFARFESDHELFIDTSANSDNPHARQDQGDGSQGEKIRFGCAVIATGAPPFVPPISGAMEGVQAGGVLTSDTVWNLNAPPKRLGVIGGGAIGMEMAQIFQDFGTKVSLFEAQERILLEVEPEVAKELTGVLNEEPNLNIYTGVGIKSISGEAGAMKMAWTDTEGKSRSFSCDYVLMATGKRPVLEPLQLDKAGVSVDSGVIRADANCRTNVPHIFAVGDVIGGLMLAHTAGQQGRVAADAILGENQLRYNQDQDCGVIFTRPQAAFVGLSQDQAKAKGMDVVEGKTPIRIDAKAMINNETHGVIKIVADKKTHRIVGVHYLADHADTLVGEGVMMVAGNMTLDQVAQAIHPHPTQTEIFGDLARRLLSRLRRTRKKA